MQPPDPKDEWRELEPLSDARWARIKRSLFDRLDEEGLVAPDALAARRGRRLRSVARLVLAGTAAAAIGAIASRALWQAPGRTLPSHIVTAESESHVALDGASLDVGPRSDLELSGDDERGIRVHLERGRVACEVAPRLGRPPFLVEAADTTVRVVGTRFAVSREQDGVRVEVTKGVVEVESRGDLHRVSAGESWVVPPPPLATPVSSAEPEPPPAVPLETRGLARSPASSPGLPGRSAPTAAEAPPPPSAPTFAALPSFASSGPPPPSAEPRRTPQERYESAASLEPTEPAAALAIYDDLAQGDGPWSANALFAEGRLQVDRGAREAARRLLERYLARFPRGPNAADARDLLEDLARSTR